MLPPAKHTVPHERCMLAGVGNARARGPHAKKDQVEQLRYSNAIPKYFSGKQINVALSIRPSHALRCLTLEPKGGISLACVAALSSLQQLTGLSTDLGTPLHGRVPLDLAEYAHHTGAISRLIS